VVCIDLKCAPQIMIINLLNTNWNIQIRSIPVNTILDAQIYIDSNYRIQKSNYALNKSYLFDKNQRLMQPAGPFALIKAKRVKKIINATKDAGASVSSVRDRAGRLSRYVKSLLFTDSKESLLIPHDSQIVLVPVGGGKIIS